MRIARIVVLVICLVFGLMFTATMILFHFAAPINNIMTESIVDKNFVPQLGYFVEEYREIYGEQQLLPISTDIEFSDISWGTDLNFEENLLEKNSIELNYGIYMDAVARSSLMYIAQENYDGFIENFPKLYRSIIDEGAYSVWITSFEEMECNEKGYETIIKGLEDVCIERPDMEMDYEKEINEYATNIVLQAVVYRRMGDNELSETRFKELENINLEYIELFGAGDLEQ